MAGGGPAPEKNAMFCGFGRLIGRRGYGQFENCSQSMGRPRNGARHCSLIPSRRPIPPLLRPGGPDDNSPAIYRWAGPTPRFRPGGTTDPAFFAATIAPSCFGPEGRTIIAQRFIAGNAHCIINQENQPWVTPKPANSYIVS